MKNKNPFGLSSTNGIEDFYRREREQALLEARDTGFFSVEMPEFWHRPEMSGYLRDVRVKPGKYDWLGQDGLEMASPKQPNLSHG